MYWGADRSAPPTGWTSDLPDGQIDQGELDGVLLNWGHTFSELTASAASAAVPQPAALVLIVVGVVAMLACRHHRR